MLLRITNFKGMTGEFDLGHVNIVTGPHDSGKTTVAHALQFLLLGYVPALGKDGGDKLVNKGPAMVTLEGWPTERHAIARKITPGADGGIKTALGATLEGNKLGPDSAKAILAEAAPPLLGLDFSGFRALRGKERRQLLMDMMGANADDLNKYTYSCALKVAMEQDATVPGFGDTFIKSMDPSGITGSLLDQVRELKNKAVAEARGTESALESMTKAVSTEDLALVASLESLDATVAKMRQSLSDAAAQNTNAAMARQRYTQDASELDRLKTLLDAYTSAVAGKASLVQEIAKLRLDLDALPSAQSMLSAAMLEADKKAIAKAEKELAEAAGRGLALKQAIAARKAMAPNVTCPSCNTQFVFAEGESVESMAKRLGVMHTTYQADKANLEALRQKFVADDNAYKAQFAQEADIARRRSDLAAKIAPLEHKLLAAKSAEAELPRLQERVAALTERMPTTPPTEEHVDIAVLTQQLREAEGRMNRALAAKVASEQLTRGAGLSDKAAVRDAWAAVWTATDGATRAYYQEKADRWTEAMYVRLAKMDAPFGKLRLDMQQDTPELYAVLPTGKEVTVDSLSTSAYIRVMTAIMGHVADAASDFIVAEVAELNHAALTSLVSAVQDIPATFVLMTCHDEGDIEGAQMHRLEARYA